MSKPADDIELLPLRHHEVYLWALQLHIMLSSGIPLLLALDSIAKDEASRVGPVCAFLSRKVFAGHSLSEASRASGSALGSFVVNLMAIGESSGRLVPVLERISSRAARREKTERALKGALAYPLFLAVVSLGMAFFMAFYMFPRLLPFLTGLGVALPWPTRALVWMTDSLSSGLLLLTIVGVGTARMISTSSDSRMARVREWLLYDSPVLGKITGDRVYSDVLSDLHLMLEAGCDLLTSLKALQTPWPEYNARIARCIEEIRGGAGFAEAVELSRMFPRGFLVQMKSGEESGRLPRIFEMLAAQLDESVQLRVTGLVQVVEPLIFVTMGVVTGFIVMATFLPLYSLVSGSM